MPFMQDGTYPPRNFATLGPSELQPPFIFIYIPRLHVFVYFKTPGRPQTQYFMLSILQSPVFLINSRFFHFLVTNKSKLHCQNNINTYGSSFFQSYRVNLQSSFKILFSIALVYSTYLPVSVFSTVHNLDLHIATSLFNFFFLKLIALCSQSCCSFHIFMLYSILPSNFLFRNILRNRLILHNFKFIVENLRFLAITIF